MKNAAEKIISEKRSIRSVAKDFNICHVTLYRYVTNIKKGNIPSVGYKPTAKVFSDEEEQIMVNYILKAADRYFGMSPMCVRKIAYSLAVKYGKKIPRKWEEGNYKQIVDYLSSDIRYIQFPNKITLFYWFLIEKSAGREWLRGFMARNSKISIRNPQATSLARATAFNQHTVQTFFDKVEGILNKFKFEPSDI